MKYAINWDLDTIFPGGSASPELQQRLTKLSEELTSYGDAVQQFDATADQLATIMQQQEVITNGFSQCGSFINALLSADVNDAKAKILSGQLSDLRPRFQLTATILAKKLTELSDESFQTLLTSEALQPIAFRLKETRREGQEQLSEAEENIINTLSLDGLEAWSQHYDTLVATIEIPFTQADGTTVNLSAGQAFNKMMGDPDAAVRQQLFDTWEKIWEKKQIFSAIH